MEFLLNGRVVRAKDVSANTTLLEYLHANGLTGVKEGCVEGECGACAVALVARNGDGGASRYRAVNSCLLFLPSLTGQEVYTDEGLARDGHLIEPRSAVAFGGGSQCGYCTPGLVVSLVTEYYRPGRTGPCDPHAMDGDLCRCTGYRPLRDAALCLGAAPDDAFRQRLERPAPPVTSFSVHAGGMRFERPESLAACPALRDAHPKARLVAGATDLAVERNLQGRRWPMLVSVEGIAELRHFEETREAIEIGAGLTLAELEERWTSAPAARREWFDLFASPLIRNRATLGGNLATASPVGDAAPLLLALNAEVQLTSSRGVRSIALRDFFTGYRQTAVLGGEMIVSISIPKPLPARLAFYKAAKRRLDDISTVAAAFVLDTDARGRITRARAAYGGVAATPILANRFERAVLGRRWDQSAMRAAQQAVAASISHLTDHRGSAAYRVALAESLIEKSPDAVRLMPARTDKVPNTSATAAFSSTDLNGAAVLDACQKIRTTLAEVAGRMLDCASSEVVFENSRVYSVSGSGAGVPFAEVTEAAYRQRLPLFASGFYRTPEIHYDPGTLRGRPFYYFAYGAAVSEVEIDRFTGQHRLLRADLLEDAGDSLSLLIDRGQIEGGFLQGAGWLTVEELLWDREGRLATNGASTYRLPSWSEMPADFRVSFLERAAEPGVVFGSKAVGEAPLMLAISVRKVIRDAVGSCGPGVVEWDSPSTPERIFFALERARASVGAVAMPAGAARS